MYATRHKHQRGRLDLALVLALAGGLLFLAGYYAGGRTSAGAVAGEVFPVATQADPEKALLAQELEIARTTSEVNRAALDLLRGEIAGYKEQVAGLEEGLRFYRSLMAPGEIVQGLSLRALELVALEGERRYAFRIVAQQEARKHELLKGGLSAEVYGLLGGERVSYPLAQLAEEVDDEVVALKFRYFQAVEGMLTLPEGFAPGGVRVVARATSPQKAEVTEDYPWQLQERFTHVGK